MLRQIEGSRRSPRPSPDAGRRWWRRTRSRRRPTSSRRSPTWSQRASRTAASTSWWSRSSAPCRPASAPRPRVRAPTPPPPARACCSWPRRCPTPPGCGLPIVMTVANRALGAPINIWNDHSDAMSQRDAGWIQLFAESNQEAVDLHVQAFALAEPLSRAGDGLHGRLRAHPRDGGDRRARTQEQVDAVLPPFRPRAVPRPRRTRSRSAPWSGPRRSPR